MLFVYIDLYVYGCICAYPLYLLELLCRNVCALVGIGVVLVAVLAHDNSVCSVCDYGVVFVNIVGVTVVILFVDI